MTFDYTSPDLWHYSGSFPYVDGNAFTFSKDVTASPPGMAQLAATLNIQSQSPSFSDDNPGRPNGPQIDLKNYVAFPFPADYTGPFPGGPCGGSWTESFDNRPYGEHQFACGVDPGAGAKPLGGDGPESGADQLLSTLKQTPGTYVLNFVPFYNNERVDDNCNVWLDPDSHTMKKAKKYTESHCGKLTVSVH